MTRACVAALALVALAACESRPEGPSILYSADPQSLENPLPDERLLTADGLALRPDWYRPFLPPKAQTGAMRAFLAKWSEDVRQVHALGSFGQVLLRTSEPVDAATLGGIASRLVREGDGFRVLERDVHVELSSRTYEGTPRMQPADFETFLVVRPAVPMPEGSTGFLVLRRGLTSAEGKAFVRPVAFNADGALLRGAAAALGVEEKEVLLLLPQRAEAIHGTFAELARFAAERFTPRITVPPMGTLPLEVGTRPVGTWPATEPSMRERLEKYAWARPADAVGRIVIGSFRAHDLRGPEGVWQAGFVAAPESAPAEELTFVATLPKGPPPPGGFQVVIGGHGLGYRNTLQDGDDESFCMDVAQLLASQGIACVGIDAPSHGSRGSSLDFFVLDRLRTTRDRFRQMVFDQQQLLTAVRAMDLDGDGQKDFAPDVGYFGNSLGAVMGASFISLEPRIRYSVLNVPGAGLADILGSDDIRDRIGLLVVTKTSLAFESPEYYGMFPLLRTMAQAVMESADPINHAQALPGEAAVLIQEGMKDLTIPNATTEHLAQVMGVEARTQSAQGTVPLRALFQAEASRFLPPDRLSGYNPHSLLFDAALFRVQATTFLKSRGTTFVAE